MCAGAIATARSRCRTASSQLATDMKPPPNSALAKKR